MINWKNIFTQFECMQTFGFVCRLTCSISCSSWWIIPFKRPWKRSCNKERERERETLSSWQYAVLMLAVCECLNCLYTHVFDLWPCEWTSDMYDLSLSPVTVITMDKFSQHSAHRPTEVTLLNHTSNPIPQRLNPPNGAAARAMHFMLFCELCKSS